MLLTEGLSNYTIGEVLKIFSENNIKHLPVVDKGGNLVGIITAVDIIRNLNKVGIEK